MTGVQTCALPILEYASGSDVYHFVLQKEHSMDISVEIDPQGNLVLD